MRKQLIDPNAWARSLKCSIDNTGNISKPIVSIQRAISRYPSGTLRILHDGRYISFYERCGNKKVYLKKDSDRIYLLARKLYLSELLRVLEAASLNPIKFSRTEHRYEKLTMLIDDFSKGNLDLARIAFAPKQYKWFAGEYRQKKIMTETDANSLKTKYGNIVKSKSEQSIENTLWEFAAPCHYEERLQINVQTIVERMKLELRENGWTEKTLFYYRNGNCFWNVPKELQFMNAPGSFWHTYDYRNGWVTIYPDFTIMLADGTRLYWEHEGLLDKVIYRINAMDRIFAMRFAVGIDPGAIIETEERESVDKDRLENIVMIRILPGLWF